MNNINGSDFNPINTYFQPTDKTGATQQSSNLDQDVVALEQAFEQLAQIMEDQITQGSGSSGMPSLYNASSLGDTGTSQATSQDDGLAELENLITQEFIALMQGSDATSSGSSSGTTSGSSNGDVALGNLNTIYGFNDTAIGDDNQDIGNWNLQIGSGDAVLGLGDTQVGNENSAIGNRDTTFGSGNGVLGNKNWISGDSNVIFGNNNGIIGASSSIDGEQDSTIGNYDATRGNHDEIHGNHDYTHGSHDITRGNRDYIHGNHDTASGSDISIHGNNVHATGSNIHVYLPSGSAGSGTLSATSGETIFGNKQGDVTTIQANGSYSETNSSGKVIAHGDVEDAKKAGIAAQLAAAKKEIKD